MWNILLNTDPSTTNRFSVFHDNKGSIDYMLQNKSKQYWVFNLSDFLEVSELEYCINTGSMLIFSHSYKVLHTFESSDPVSYIKSLQHTHSELFI